MRCFAIQSHDDGATWSTPVEITHAFEPFRENIDWQVIATGPGHDIQTRTGRLVAPFWMADYDNRLPQNKGVGIIYNDDHGKKSFRIQVMAPIHPHGLFIPAPTPSNELIRLGGM
jgi:sialidase-1